MKTIATTFFLLFLTYSFAQTVHPTKCFANFDEFKRNTPSLEFNLLLKKKDKGDIFMNGGITNHKLQKLKPLSFNDKVQKEIWGLIINDTVYVNSYPYSEIKGFNQLIGNGYYSYFVGETAIKPILQKQLRYVNPDPKKINFGPASPFVILPSGKIQFLSFELLKELIRDNVELSKELEILIQLLTDTRCLNI